MKTVINYRERETRFFNNEEEYLDYIDEKSEAELKDLAIFEDGQHKGLVDSKSALVLISDNGESFEENVKTVEAVYLNCTREKVAEIAERNFPMDYVEIKRVKLYE